MIDVIQVYKSKEIFTKSTYTPENRKRIIHWNDSFDSTQGFLENNTLVLPTNSKKNPDLKTAGLIIIQDIKGWGSFMVNNHFEGLDLPEWFKNSRRDFFIKDNKTLFTFNQLGIAKSFEIFKIRKTDNDSYELKIDYSANSMKIGIPERENHIFSELRKSKPIRYKINGKSDFTMSGRKERTFCELDYIMEWIGTADKIEYRELNKIKRSKKVPLERAKVIDERKVLW